MKRKILTAVIILACGQAKAVDWTPIGVAYDGSYAYIDFSKIIKRQGITKAWIRQEYQTEQIGEPDSKYMSYNVKIWHVALDCANEKAATSSLTYYSGKTNYPVAQWETKDWQLNFSDVIPGSHADVVFSLVCNAEKKSNNGRAPFIRGAGV